MNNRIDHEKVDGQGGVNIHFDDESAFLLALRPPEGFTHHPFGWQGIIAESEPERVIKKISTKLYISSRQDKSLELQSTFTLDTKIEKDNPTLPLDFDEQTFKTRLRNLPYQVNVTTRKSEFGYSYKEVDISQPNINPDAHTSESTIWGFSQRSNESKEAMRKRELPLLNIGWSLRRNISVNPADAKSNIDDYILILSAFLESVYVKSEGGVPNIQHAFMTPQISQEITKAVKIERNKGELQKTRKEEASFDEVGGQKEAVEQLKLITNQLKNPEVFKKWGASVPKGILLVGPPGNGKTLLGKIMASESGANFDPLNLSDLMQKYVGETEEVIRSHFQKARDNRSKKTIIFLDEVDGIGKSREKAKNEYTANFLLALTQEWDGIKENPNVIVMGTTNRLGDIDPALLRENRFDIIVQVNNPNLEGIKEILNIRAKKAKGLAGKELFTEVDFGQVAVEIEKKFGQEKTSGARVAEIIQRVLRNKANQELTTGTEQKPVTIDDFVGIINQYEKRN